MKPVLIVAALAGIAFLGIKFLVSGAPQGRLSSIITVPGATISKLSFDGGSVATIALIIGAAFVVLAIAYSVMSK